MTASMLPATGRPRMTVDECRAALAGHGIVDGVAILGVRGYYRDTMGAPGRNDRGIYDDALFVVTRTVFVAVNANTDPSVARNGVAVLEPGLWRYQVGKHGITRAAAGGPPAYTALVQAAPVTVRRDGQGLDTGWFGINIHRGSATTTSSLGCQTVHPTQWDNFINLVRCELVLAKQVEVPYLLIDGPTR